MSGWYRWFEAPPPTADPAGHTYMGQWDPNTDSLPSDDPGEGHYWVVSDAGDFSLDGATGWQPGDWALYNGDHWERIVRSSNPTIGTGRSTYQVFTASGVWEPPEGALEGVVFVQAWGGGGGSSYGGGGGGEYAEALIPLAQIETPVTVTVGAGGTAGSASQDLDGGDGGTSSFGDHLVAEGGEGGSPGSASSAPGGNGAGFGRGVPDDVDAKTMWAGGAGGGPYGGNAGLGGGGGQGQLESSQENAGPGVSRFGGNGGSGYVPPVATGGAHTDATPGVAPGGGGGGGGTWGARGEVRVTFIPTA